MTYRWTYEQIKARAEGHPFIAGIRVTVVAPVRAGDHTLWSEIMTDEKLLMQQIDLIRESIRRDWKKLALGNLTFDQRKAIREDIQMGISALKDLQARLWKLPKKPS